MDIVTFLNARLDEREAIARAAAEEAGGHSVFGEVDRTGQWSATSDGISADNGYRNGPFAADPYGTLADEIGAHIVLHDPEAVLRDVAAKRKLIQLWQLAGEAIDRDMSDEWLSGRWAALTDVVEALAEPYAAHPDYDSEWPSKL